MQTLQMSHAGSYIGCRSKYHENIPEMGSADQKVNQVPTCAPALSCAYHNASANVSLPSASVSLTSTVMPAADVCMSEGLVALPLTMFSQAAVMKWTCKAINTMVSFLMV
eukprot:GHUV01026147.1.p1 GENE.GHUV01026147.1~~GHUV01026147.1.p1  ORF type:complete len:110 (+),score=15.17 GHUV01026147.1:38-367(+)